MRLGVRDIDRCELSGRSVGIVVTIVRAVGGIHGGAGV